MQTLRSLAGHAPLDCRLQSTSPQVPSASVLPSRSERRCSVVHGTWCRSACVPLLPTIISWCFSRTSSATRLGNRTVAFNGQIERR